jgi:predicted methyltransferase
VTRLTELAQAAVRAVLHPGDFVIDATAGNGHDSRFLCDGVGPTGRVFSFDIQREALARTAERTNHATQLVLIESDHAALQEMLPEQYRGHIAAVMFDLGYLPGGNKTITTQTDSSVQAISASLELLRPGGVVTILAYTGHPGGLEEAAAVEGLLNQLNPHDYRVQVVRGDSVTPQAPRLYIVTDSSQHPE